MTARAEYPEEIAKELWEDPSRSLSRADEGPPPARADSVLQLSGPEANKTLEIQIHLLKAGQIASIRTISKSESEQYTARMK